MADQIPLYPVRSAAAAAAASHKRAAYYSAAGPGPAADRRGR
jgi:phospholipid-translocating ATPase